MPDVRAAHAISNIVHQAISSTTIQHVTATAKRFLTAYGAHAIFMWIQRLLRTGRFSRFSPGLLVFALRQAVKAVTSIASLRVGAAVAAWGVVFKHMQHITNLLHLAFPRSAALLGSPGRRSAVSGAVAGAVAAAALPTRLRRSIALHGAVRGAALLAAPAFARASPALRAAAPVAAFTACSGVIMGCWFYAPHALPRMMRQWISAMAQMDHRLLMALRLLRSGEVRYGHPSDALHSYCLDHGLPPHMGDPVHGQLSCTVVHPASGEACWHNVGVRWRNGFLAAAALYLPVHLLSQGVACVTATNAATNTAETGQPSAQGSDPNKADVDVYDTGVHWLRTFAGTVPRGARRAIEGALRSSSFLATFIASIWGTICCMRHALRDDTIAGPLLGGTIAGLSVLLEAPSRRGELCLYLLPRTLQSAWALVLPKQRVAGFSVLALAFASACVAQQLEADGAAAVGVVSPPPPSPGSGGGTDSPAEAKEGGGAAPLLHQAAAASGQQLSPSQQQQAPAEQRRRRRGKHLGVALAQWMME